jgi:Holliday junction resolvasome RuvABC endonuclease subunit
MMDLEIQARIDQLYADMKPLMNQYGMKPQTIEQRYERIQQRKAEEARLLAAIPRPRFKLPKL